MRLALWITGMSAAMLLGGCADMPLFGKSAPGGVQPAANADHPRAEAVLHRDSQPVRAPAADTERNVQRDAGATLRDGIRLYNEGDFGAAIMKFNAPEIQTANAATRVSALKYTAFSYCVTQRPILCRQAFDKALRIDPNFTLAPGEEGHPMWGPVFARARAGK